MNTCIKCGEEQDWKQFIFKRQDTATCRTCIRREQSKQIMRAKRVHEGSRVHYEPLSLALSHEHKLASEKHSKKQLQQRFNKVTARIRSRLKQYQNSMVLSAYQQRMMMARQQQVAAYERALAVQVALLERGETPVDINFYVELPV